MLQIGNHAGQQRGDLRPYVTWDRFINDGVGTRSPGNAGTWDGSREVLDTRFANVPPEIRELRVRADAGFGFNPVFVALEERPAQDAVVARLTPAFKRLLSGISYEPVNHKWDMA
jgi:hypothetical protein